MSKVLLRVECVKCKYEEWFTDEDGSPYRQALRDGWRDLGIKKGWVCPKHTEAERDSEVE